MAQEKTTNTLQDLEAAVRDLTYNRGEVKKYRDMAESKKQAMESHLREEALAQKIVEQSEQKVKRIAANLEK